MNHDTDDDLFADLIEVPARQEVPPEVLARLERRVVTGLDHGQPRNRARWVSVAAAVALLVAGAAATTYLLHRGGPTQPDNSTIAVAEPAPSSPLNLAQANAQLDRCWATIQQAGRASRFPARNTWSPVMLVTGHLATVTGVRAAGKRFFCQTTVASATVTDPDAPTAYVPGSHTGALLISSAGVIAGVVDPAWQAVGVKVTATDLDSEEGAARQQDGLFAFISDVSTHNATITVSRGGSGAWPAQSLPSPSAPPVTTSGPGGVDRSSARGSALGACIEKSGTSVPDEATWQPGAMVETGGERVIMATNAQGVAVCLQQQQRTQFLAYIARLPAPSGKPALVGVAPSLGTQPLVAGTVPAEATSMRIVLPNGAEVTADVANSTFAALLPASQQGLRCRIYAADNRLLYSGPLGA